MINFQKNKEITGGNISGGKVTAGEISDGEVTKCEANEWACLGGGQCIDEANKCDLLFNCSDKSDEMFCGKM